MSRWRWTNGSSDYKFVAWMVVGIIVLLAFVVWIRTRAANNCEARGGTFFQVDRSWVCIQIIDGKPEKI